MVHAADLEYDDYDALPLGWPHDQGVQSLGYEVLAWAETYLAQPDGDTAGNPWRWRESQARFVAWWYAVDENGEFLFTHGQIVLSKGAGKSPLAAILSCCELGGPVAFSHFDTDGTAVGKPHPSPWITLCAASYEQTGNMSELLASALNEGPAREVIGELDPGLMRVRSKNGIITRVAAGPRSAEGHRPTASFHDEALALDTPIPTPQGWTTMGDLADGDEVYAVDGSITRVREAFPVQYDRDTYRVTFNDGTSVVASDGHWWKVRRSRNRNCPVIQATTREMFEQQRTFYLPENFEQLEASEADLPIDPYVLGLWLGDGSSQTSTIACHADDLEETRSLVEACGESTRPRDANHFAISEGGCRPKGNLVERLRGLGVLGNKHIPIAYLRGSARQRLALMQGLMDSDGSVRRGGHCRFANTNRELLTGFRELALSLGYFASPAKYQVRTESERSHWLPLGQVSFKATTDVNPFRLSRKRGLVTGQRSTTRTALRSIVSIEKVDSVPVRCIAVEHESRLFLAGEGMHPTRNTQHWVSGNQGVSLARTLRRNLAKTGGRALELTNAWMPGEDSVAEATYASATDTTGRSQSGLRAQKRILRWHPQIHVEDLTSENSLRAALEALYSDFPWVNVQRFIDDAETDMTASDIRRFFLNEITSEDDALVTDAEWSACRVPEDEWKPLERGETITLGFDGGKTDDSTALVACRVSDRTFHVLGLWEKPEAAKQDRTQRWHVPREVVDAKVMDAIKEYDVAGFYADVALWESYIDKWSSELVNTVSVRASAHSVVGWDMRGRQQALTRGTENLVAGIIDAAVGHNGDSGLRRHVLNARRRANTYGITFGKESRESPKKVDALAAMQLADMARTDFENSGKTRRKQGGKGAIFFT